MPAAEGFRTWVRCPPPPPLQPVRTVLRGLEEVKDLEGGFGLVIGPPDLRFDREEPDLPQHRLSTKADFEASASSTGWSAISRAAIHSTGGALKTAFADASYAWSSARRARAFRSAAFRASPSARVPFPSPM